MNSRAWQKALESVVGKEPAEIGPDFARLMAQLHAYDGELASGFYRRLTDWIHQFELSLDAQHEVGIRLVSSGEALTFHLAAMNYWNPALIMFAGSTNAGEPVQLIQHVSQISILLLKVPRAEPGQPKVPIGFAAAPVAGA